VPFISPMEPSAPTYQSAIPFPRGRLKSNPTRRDTTHSVFPRLRTRATKEQLHSNSEEAQAGNHTY